MISKFKHYSIVEIFKNQKKILNSKISVSGWVKNKRSSKLGLSFIDLHDGSCFSTIQVVVNKNNKNYHNQILKLNTGCSIVVKGILVKSFKEKNMIEISSINIKVLGWVENNFNYPISSKKHTMKHLRNFVHLRPRTKIIYVISIIRNFLFQYFHKYLWKNRYIWIPSPIITSTNAEGAGEMFKVSKFESHDISLNKDKKISYKKDFFNKETFLTVSSQLYLETYACALSKVYTFSPVFRAENSNTNRHLSEFWMLEVESAFLDLKKIINFVEKITKYVVKKILKYCFQELFFLKNTVDYKIFDRLNMFIISKFIVLNYSEAIKILKTSKISSINNISYGKDLNSEQERYLSDVHFKNVIVIKNYPKDIKAFYMRLNKDKITVSGADFIFPGVGEIIGCSQREERKTFLKNRIKELKLNKNSYDWYIDLRKYGTIPHSGFGLGLERFILYVTGIRNIKDAIPFPRVPKSANF